jgi:hypothetical protein
MPSPSRTGLAGASVQSTVRRHPHRTFDRFPAERDYRPLPHDQLSPAGGRAGRAQSGRPAGGSGSVRPAGGRVGLSQASRWADGSGFVRPRQTTHRNSHTVGGSGGSAPRPACEEAPSSAVYADKEASGLVAGTGFEPATSGYQTSRLRTCHRSSNLGVELLRNPVSLGIPCHCRSTLGTSFRGVNGGHVPLQAPGGRVVGDSRFGSWARAGTHLRERYTADTPASALPDQPGDTDNIRVATAQTPTVPSAETPFR